jgi:BrnA antitoxin of type II toxin-antitoxin system
VKKEYDFSKGKRGAVVPLGTGKTRITIRIDDDILQWFRNRVHDAGGGNYQTAINDALRSFIDQGSIEQTLRRVLREELRGNPRLEPARAFTPR